MFTHLVFKHIQIEEKQNYSHVPSSNCQYLANVPTSLFKYHQPYYLKCDRVAPATLDIAQTLMDICKKIFFGFLIVLFCCFT